MAVLKYNGEYISGSGEISMKLTQAQYDALSEGQKNNGTTYFVETEDDNWDGKNIKYNDTQSVTGAIDSLNDTISKKKIYRKVVATSWDGSSNRSLGLAVDEYTVLSIGGGATYQVPFFSGNGWYAHNFNSITSGTGFETYVAYIKNSDINIVS